MALGMPPGTVTDYWILAAGLIFFGGILSLVGFRLYTWYKSLQPAGIFHEGPATEVRNRHRSYFRNTLEWIYSGPSLHSASLSHPPRQGEKLDFGLDPAIIESLPTFTFNGEIRQLDSTESKECAVCIEEFKEGEKVRLLPTCFHCFHANCIDMWLFSHTTCPICRSEVASVPGPLLAPIPDTSSPEREANEGHPQYYFSFSDISDEMGASPSGPSEKVPVFQPYVDLELGDNARGPQISETDETAGRQFQDDCRSAAHSATTGDSNASEAIEDCGSAYHQV